MDDIFFPGFKRSLPMSLMRAREAVMKEFTPSLKEHKLTPQQWRVIRALQDENGLDISELAERCYLLMPSLSRIIQNLESRQLVERKGVAADQRRSAIFLNDKGREIFELITPESTKSYQRIREKFGYGKLELLYELLGELVEKLDEEEDGSP